MPQSWYTLIVEDPDDSPTGYNIRRVSKPNCAGQYVVYDGYTDMQTVKRLWQTVSEHCKAASLFRGKRVGRQLYTHGKFNNTEVKEPAETT